MKTRCLYDKLMSVRDLKPHPKNRNDHPKDQIERLAKILEYQGWRYPIKVSKQSGYITSGHGRLEAAVHNNWKEVPVNFQDYDSDEQEYADVQADNAIASWAELDLSAVNSDLGDIGPDFDLDLLGIKDFVLEPADKLNPQCDEDEVPENVEPKTKLGDIYQLGRHRLMCGDSTSIDAIEKLMNGEKADMVFTDPPYGVNEQTDRKERARGQWASAKDFSPVIGDENDDTAKGAFSICIAMAPLVVYWGANYYTGWLPKSSSWICWDKREPHMGPDSNADFELAWTNRGGPGRFFRHLWKGLIKASERGESRVHPTQKPVTLAEWAMTEYPKENIGSVLDLFGGSGSTLIACEKTRRRCFMMELDPHYCDVIVARWEKYTGKKAELVTP